MAGRKKSRGSKKARTNDGVWWTRAFNNPGHAPSYAIPLSTWPREYYEWGSAPRLANWTSDPVYSYEQFARDNAPTVVYEWAGPPSIFVTTNHPNWQRSLQEAKRRHGPPSRFYYVRSNPSDFDAKAVPWNTATNAGPFLPEMFPYGQGGRPAEYEFKKNPRPRRNRGSRGGFSPAERDDLPNWYFLKPSSRGWPAGDPRRGARDETHAQEVIVYMNRGFGNRADYPALIKELANRYPVEDEANKGIWTLYRQHHDDIQDKMLDRGSRKELPTIRDLRGRELALANRR
jgi:hypothetical protein